MITTRAGLDAISQTAASTWLSEIERIEKLAAEWFERWNNLDPAIAPRNDVQQLIATAPNDWARGMVITMRGKPHRTGRGRIARDAEPTRSVGEALLQTISCN